MDADSHRSDRKRVEPDPALEAASEDRDTTPVLRAEFDPGNDPLQERDRAGASSDGSRNYNQEKDENASSCLHGTLRRMFRDGGKNRWMLQGKGQRAKGKGRLKVEG
jgi:hypothetical protein